MTRVQEHSHLLTNVHRIERAQARNGLSHREPLALTLRFRRVS
jgi:hypothetical protein